MNDEYKAEPQAYAIVNTKTDSLVEFSRERQLLEKLKNKGIYDEEQLEVRSYYSEAVVDDMISSLLDEGDKE